MSDGTIYSRANHCHFCLRNVEKLFSETWSLLHFGFSNVCAKITVNPVKFRHSERNYFFPRPIQIQLGGQNPWSTLAESFPTKQRNVNEKQLFQPVSKLRASSELSGGQKWTGNLSELWTRFTFGINAWFLSDYDQEKQLFSQVKYSEDVITRAKQLSLHFWSLNGQEVLRHCYQSTAPCMHPTFVIDRYDQDCWPWLSQTGPVRSLNMCHLESLSVFTPQISGITDTLLHCSFNLVWLHTTKKLQTNKDASTEAMWELSGSSLVRVRRMSPDWKKEEKGSGDVFFFPLSLYCRKPFGRHGVKHGHGAPAAASAFQPCSAHLG